MSEEEDVSVGVESADANGEVEVEEDEAAESGPEPGPAVEPEPDVELEPAPDRPHTPAEADPVTGLSRRALAAAGALVAGVALVAGLLPTALASGGAVVPDIPPAVSSDKPSGALNISEMVETVAPAVFQVHAGTQTGTAWLVNETTLVTNDHVLRHEVGDAVKVTNREGAELQAVVLALDEQVDVALLRVPKQDADPLPMIGVRGQRVGEAAVVAGYPLGLELSFNAGVVSAVDTPTTLRQANGQHSLLQVDAAINPGSSGGPVLNADGSVMGMATFRPDTVGGRPVGGVGFAIPSNDINVALRQFEQHGDISYGRLGISMEPADGPVVSHVSSRSPAEHAGIEAGDRVVSVAGHPTSTYTEVSRYLHMYRPGQVVVLVVERGAETLTFRATLGRPSGQ